MSKTSYMYAFEVRPELRPGFAEWARTKGVLFWLSRRGLLSYRTYRVHAGSGASLALAEFESGEALGRVLDSSEWATLLTEFQSYITDPHSWVLGPGATGEEPLQPPSRGGSDL
jgi:hypothetical protein